MSRRDPNRRTVVAGVAGLAGLAGLGGPAAWAGSGPKGGRRRPVFLASPEDPATQPVAVVSNPFPAPGRMVRTLEDLDRVAGTWRRIRSVLVDYYGDPVFRLEDQTGAVGAVCVLANQGSHPLARPPFTALARWLEVAGPRNHVGLGVVRHQDGAVWEPFGLEEVEARTRRLLETPGIGDRIASLTGNSEPDNADRRPQQATRPPQLVADQVAAMMAGADAAGWRGPWVVPPTNCWDELGQDYATRLRRALEEAGVAHRFAAVGMHGYVQRNPRARRLLTDAVAFARDLWDGLPVFADQYAVTPDNRPAATAVGMWFLLVHHGSTGGWWPFRAGIRSTPLGDNWLVDVRTGARSPHGAVLERFLDEIRPYRMAQVKPGPKPGGVTVDGRPLVWVDSEEQPWRWS